MRTMICEIDFPVLMFWAKPPHEILPLEAHSRMALRKRLESNDSGRPEKGLSSSIRNTSFRQESDIQVSRSD